MTAPRSTTLELPPPPAPPPRLLTPRALRRSIQEPRVRFWWLAALTLLVVSLYFLVDRTQVWLQELHIVRTGMPINATVLKVGQGEVEGVANLSPSYPVQMEIEFKGQKYYVDGFLEGRKESISLKQVVQIKIDPENPEHWTYLTEAPPFTHALLSAGLVLPFAIAAAVVSFLLRRRVLTIWRTGVASAYRVEATRQSALAPSSRSVHCRALEGRSQRLINVFIPRGLADCKKGDVLWLIHPHGKPTAALPAVAYAE